jgi:hypothetical protein
VRGPTGSTGRLVARRRGRASVIAASLALFGMLGTAPGADVLAHVFGLLIGGLLGIGPALAQRRPVGRSSQWVLAVAAGALVLACWSIALATTCSLSSAACAVSSAASIGSGLATPLPDVLPTPAGPMAATPRTLPGRCHQRPVEGSWPTPTPPLAALQPHWPRPVQYFSHSSLELYARGDVARRSCAGGLDRFRRPT